MTTTMHDCTSWNVHRATLIEHSHEVDGVAFIGGRGQRLDAMLERTYRSEAAQLGSDLAACLAALPAPVSEEVLEELKPILGQAAGSRHDVHVSAAVTVSTFTEDDPVEEPRRGRGRRQDDAAGALTDMRDEGSGEVLAVEPVPNGG